MSTARPPGGEASGADGRAGEAPNKAGRAGEAAERLKERIYATLTMLAVTVGLTAWEDLTAADAAAAIAATALGLWLAGVVADVQARTILSGPGVGRHRLPHTLHVTSPLLLSAVGPLVMTGLSAAGELDLDEALLIAAAANTASLFAWGYRGGRRMGGSAATALVGGALNTVIGLGVAAVKLFAGH